MRLLSLHQPWASLIFLGFKTNETRGRPFPPGLLGQVVAIHAAKTTKSWQAIGGNPALAEVCQRAFKNGVLDVPFGAILGTVIIAGSERAELVRDKLGPDELACGDYGDGRFAWPLKDAHRLPVPVTYSGSQGLPILPLAVRLALMAARAA